MVRGTNKVLAAKCIVLLERIEAAAKHFQHPEGGMCAIAADAIHLCDLDEMKRELDMSLRDNGLEAVRYSDPVVVKGYNLLAAARVFKAAVEAYKK